MSIQLIVMSLILGLFALSANLAAFAMIDQINQKLPEGKKVNFFPGERKSRKKTERLPG
jgi:hypothetical protein